MTGYWNRAKTYLGLGTEEDYLDYGLGDTEVEVDRSPRTTPDSHQPARRPRPTAPAAVRREEPNGSLRDDPDDWEGGAVRVIDASEPAGNSAGSPPRRNVVRPVRTAATTRPKVVAPGSFNDAQQIGDLFRSQQPVILNLQGIDRDLARRLLDFASGVSYALAGSVERVSSHVYLLTPEDVEVSDDDRQKLRDHAVSTDGLR